MAFKKFRESKLEEMARKADLPYKTVNKSGKETSDSDKISKVIVSLKGNDSGVATKLANKLESIRQQKSLLDEQEKELKQKAMDSVDDLFDASDEIWSRVVETASVAMTISKASQRPNFDHKKFMEELLVLFPKLEKQILELKEKFTTVIDVASKITTGPIKSESISSIAKMLLGKIKDIGKNFLKSVDSWSKKYDKELNAIQTGILSAMGESSKFSFTGFLMEKESEESKSEEEKEADVDGVLGEENREVSGSLLKNLIDILHDYVYSEYLISKDEKDQIFNNMKISLGSHSRGIWKKGPQFTATSKFVKNGGDERDVEIVIDITTNKF